MRKKLIFSVILLIAIGFLFPIVAEEVSNDDFSIHENENADDLTNTYEPQKTIEVVDLSGEYETNETLPFIEEANAVTNVLNQKGSITPFAMGDVRIRENGAIYASLEDAVLAINAMNLPDNFTIEILNDLTVTANINVTSNITLLGMNGAHSISMGNFKISLNGGLLLLGDGTASNVLTIMGTQRVVEVVSGFLDARAGIVLKNTQNNAPLTFTSPTATGHIRGGEFEASGETWALDVRGGAQLSEISGGVFKGNVDAVHISDENSIINKISGGEFYQTDPTTSLHGSAIFVQNKSKIGEISGGYFESLKSSALTLVRDAWVDKITGGEFVTKNTTTGVIQVAGTGTVTKVGIDEISGGIITGGGYGVLNIGNNALINKISGGSFESASIGLQNDVGGVIQEITGGTILGHQGILNNAKIGEIGGSVKITGNGGYSSGYAIYNYSGGTIGEISGGAITSSSHSIINTGTISLITGGTIIGGRSAIHCEANPNGHIDKITGGVFWGKADTAIRLGAASRPLQLEPGLDTAMGNGRYESGIGTIFTNEQKVVYPHHIATSQDYYMSSSKFPVSGIDGAQFKYLTYGLTLDLSYDLNGGDIGSGPSLEPNLNPEFERPLNTLVIPTHANVNGNEVEFVGWSEVVYPHIYANDEPLPTLITNVTITNNDVVVYAVWKYKQGSPVQPPHPPQPPIPPLPPTPPIPQPPLPHPPTPLPDLQPPSKPSIAPDTSHISNNKVDNSVKTFDSTNKGIWMGMMGVSILVIIKKVIKKEND